MDLIARRRVMLAAGKKPGLPPEYQESEYIEFGPYTSGYAFFELGISFGEITQVEETLQEIPVIASEGSMLTTYSRAWQAGLSFVQRSKNANVTVADVSQYINWTQLLYGCFYTTYPNIWSNSKIKSKNLLLRNGVIVVRDLIPCYRKSDNKPGMYDLCGSICPLTNSPFYINAGTGEFLVGPDVN